MSGKLRRWCMVNDATIEPGCWELTSVLYYHRNMGDAASFEIGEKVMKGLFGLY